MFVGKIYDGHPTHDIRQDEDGDDWCVRCGRFNRYPEFSNPCPTVPS